MQSCKEIAQEQGVTAETIRRKAKAAGFALARGKGKTTKFSEDQKAKILEQK